MTAPGPGDPRIEDIDALAEYAEGLLDGTAEGDRITRLIESDPWWRRAYAGLRPASEVVSGQLAGLADEPIPAEVLAQLEATLAEVGEGSAGGEPPSNVRELKPRRWSRRKLVSVVGAAAAVCLFAAVGVGTLNSVLTSQNAERIASAPEGGSGAGRPAPRDGAGSNGVQSAGRAYRLTASGTDWQPDQLAGLATRSRSIDTAATPAIADVPPQLHRLTEGHAMEACAEAIRLRFAVRYGQPVYVDLAKFRGAAAVVAVLGSGNQNTVLIIDTSCGTAKRADVVYGPVSI